MEFFSTRDPSLRRPFAEVLLKGIAEDGGLYLPVSVPDFSDRLDELSRLEFPALFREIAAPFCDGIEPDVLDDLCRRACEPFSLPSPPLVDLRNARLLELFHGPTLAFKDFALQFLGNLFDWMLKRRGESLNVICATSGDTGSAAAAGLAGKDNVNLFILYPAGGVSPAQELQMTAPNRPNVFPVRIDGTFDDGQSIVKTLLNDKDFSRSMSLGAVNSINFFRIAAQTVYYFHAYFLFVRKTPATLPKFVVPTGNFGNVYAGLLARKMGLPCEKFLLAVNENDILARCLETGEYAPQEVKRTMSPSMDIQTASNFERLLFEVGKGDGADVVEKMESLRKNGRFVLRPNELELVRQRLEGVSVDEGQAGETLREVFRREGYLLDPHTAVAVRAAERSGKPNCVCLATAHPAKFRETLVGMMPEADALATHPSLSLLRQRKARKDCLPADAERVKNYVREKILRRRNPKTES